MNIDKFHDADLWKGVILFGLNAATYKMALAKVLLDFSQQGKSQVKWDELSEAFLMQYIDRLDNNQMPQQAIPTRLTVMERVVSGLKTDSISQSKAIDMVGSSGLDNVIPRFQTIGMDRRIVKEHFYEFEFGKTLRLKDSLLGFSAHKIEELENELLARWSLLEGAYKINQSAFELSNDIRETYLKKGYERTSLTGNLPFLSGYQGNICFYCGEPMEGPIHIDHVLPRQVIYHDEIWNLVLAHSDCNLLKSDRLVGPHFIQKLIARNENIMGSSHPWKHKISKDLGDTFLKRVNTLNKHYENVKAVLGSNWWGGGTII